MSPIIDCHLHIIGNGSSGSGCKLYIKGYRKLFGRILLKSMSLPQSALDGPLDELYLQRILSMVRSSSARAAVVLAHEHVRDYSGKVIEGFGAFYVPNEYICELSQKHPELLPGVSIHPARPDALEELERCLENNAVLMKLLPNCQNLDCSDKRFLPFWQRMADAGIPFLAHTGGELSLPVYNRKFANPEILRLPLECGVKIIAAHSGTNSILIDPNYMQILGEMLKTYPNLYCDNSALMTPLRSGHLKRLMESPFAERMVYGSDIPIAISGRWAYLRGLVKKADYKHWETQDNLLERDIQLKKLMGFPAESFTRLRNILRLNEKQKAFLDF